MDFNTDPPTVGTCSINLVDQQIEGTASISDSLGRLLFYSDGRRLWDWNDQVIIDTLRGHQSATNAAFVVPRPEHQTEYYLFTLDAAQNQLQNGLCYSRVTACRDGGVSIAEANVLLAQNMTEKITAVRHQNGVDYWLITHDFATDTFRIFMVSSVGIYQSGTYHAGVVHSDPNSGYLAAVGSMKAAPDGALMTVSLTNPPSKCDIVAVNQTTGEISSVITFAPDTSDQGILEGVYGVSYSSSGQFLYLGGMGNYNVWQFDVSYLPNDLNGFRASRKLVYSGLNSDPDVPNSFQQMQLGPDGKIYLVNLNSPYVAVIHQPDLIAPVCNFEDSAFVLIHPAEYGLPSFIDSYDYTASGLCEPNVVAELDDVSLFVYPNPANQKVRLQVTPHLAAQAGSGQQVRNAAITDMLGHTVLNSLPNKVGSGEVSFEMDISTLAPGLYTISATLQSGETLRQRLVVQR